MFLATSCSPAMISRNSAPHSGSLLKKHGTNLRIRTLHKSRTQCTVHRCPCIDGALGRWINCKGTAWGLSLNLLVDDSLVNRPSVRSLRPSSRHLDRLVASKRLPCPTLMAEHHAQSSLQQLQ
jgi:hypothetical protein